MKTSALRRRRRGGAANPWGNDFVLTVQTTATPETFTIPCSNTGTYNAVIDWGDGGATSAITAYNDADLAHSYATPGTYTIRISGSFPYIYFNNAGDRAKVRTVEQMGRVGWAAWQNSFYGCSGLTAFTVGACDLPTSLSWASSLRAMPALTALNLSGLAGAQPTNLSNTFFGNTSLQTLDMTLIDFSANATLAGAWRGMTALTSLLLPDNAVDATCTSLANMLYQTAALPTFNTTGWDTSSVTSFSGALRSMGAVDVDISGWRFTSATDTTVFLNGSTLATAQYDAALIEWDGIDVPNSLSFDMGSSTYTIASAGAARAGLVASDLWVITDGGGI